MWEKEETSDPHLLQAQQVRNYLLSVTKGEREKKVLLAVCAGLAFPDIYS